MREREGFMKRKTIEDYLWYYAETIKKKLGYLSHLKENYKFYSMTQRK